MELTTEQLEYLVTRYWLHYYPELTGKRWSSNKVKSTEAIVSNCFEGIERRLYAASLLSLPRYKIMDYTFNQPRFSHFEWRLEVSGYGASVIEPLCAMDLVLKLGEVLHLVEPILAGGGAQLARRRIALRCRPCAFVIARVMRHISKAELPELLSHEHEFIRGLAAQRFVDTPDEGTSIYQYRFAGGTTGSFCGSVLSP